MGWVDWSAFRARCFRRCRHKTIPLHLTISAARYGRRALEKDVPQDFNFPGTFTPQELDIALHRESVFIAGRTARLINNASTPLPDVQIAVTGIWRTAPPANVSVPPDPANIVALVPPLYADRAALTQSVTPTGSDCGHGSRQSADGGYRRFRQSDSSLRPLRVGAGKYFADRCRRPRSRGIHRDQRI